MTVRVNHSVEATLPQQATLSDLTELVNAAIEAGLPPSARVYVNVTRGDQRDPGFTTLTVRKV